MPKSLPRNIIAGLISQLCMLALALITTPVLVRGLGTAHYGLWNLALAVCMWVGWTNMIFHTATIRFIGHASGRQDITAMRAAHRAMRFWAALAGMGLFGLLLAATPWLAQTFFREQGAVLNTVKWVLVIQALCTLFQVLCAVEHGTIIANQRLDYSHALRTIAVLMQSGGAAIGVYNGWGVVHVAVWFAVIQIAEWVSGLVLANHLQPKTAERLPVDAAYWGNELLRFGAVLFVGYFAAQFFLPMSRIIIGAFETLDQVAYFAVPLALAINAKTIATYVSGAMLPVISEQVGRKDFDALKALYLRGIRWAWVVIVPLCALAIAMGEPFIKSWISPEFGRHAGPLVAPLVVGVNVYYLATIPQVVFQGMGRPLPWALLSSISGIAHVLLGIGLVGSIGTMGVALSLLVSSALYLTLMLCLLGRRLGVGAMQYLRAFDLRVLIAGAVIGFAMAQAVMRVPENLPTVIGMGVLGLGLFGFTLPLWMPEEERSWLVRQMKKMYPVGQ